ncbi:EF hand family protein [Tritrichomonas foetus]|uniref:EF hand family protein n=1 Tax=Tritrichomonas foetus TaxID=1144522 RepID=A0A1J4JCJ9_9EUKA|nr:EF hand family protein [Tritrichomonas foetus]|eukprot:OHS96902.1 EF hand family protein [Tritrichomonas foetus]
MWSDEVKIILLFTSFPNCTHQMTAIYEETGFSKAQLRALKRSFKKLDLNGDGELQPDELSKFMEENGMKTDFLKAIYRLFDKNNDGVLQFKEFCQYLSACQKTNTTKHYLHRLVFASVDSDHDNLITLKEMVEFADLCGIKMTPQEIEREAKRINDNSDAFEFKELVDVLGL